MTIGERIRDLREGQGLRQTELACRIGVSKQTLYKYERNIVTNIPKKAVEAMATALSTSPAYLMGWEENVHN